MKKEYKKFSDYTVEERVKVVRELMEAGHSNKTAAAVLGTTKGAVARIRWDHKIPSLHKPLGLGKKGEPPSPTIIAIEVPPGPGAAALERDRKENEKLPPLKLAVSEKTQCIEPVPLGALSYRCGFEREPGSPYCRMHRPSSVNFG